jgi:hypothetical protein
LETCIHIALPQRLSLVEVGLVSRLDAYDTVHVAHSIFLLPSTKEDIAAADELAYLASVATACLFLPSSFFLPILGRG